MRTFQLWMVSCLVLGQASLIMGVEDTTLESWDADAWLSGAMKHPTDVSLAAPDWMSESADLGESMGAGCEDNPAWAADCPHLADHCSVSEAMKIKCRKTCGCGPEVEDPIPHVGKNATKVNAKLEEPDIDMKKAIAGEAVTAEAKAAKKKLKEHDKKVAEQTKERREQAKAETKKAAKKNDAKTEKKANDLKKLVEQVKSETKVKVVKPKKKEDVEKKAAADASAEKAEARKKKAENDKKAEEVKVKKVAETEKAGNATKVAEPKKLAAKKGAMDVTLMETFMQLEETLAVHATAGNGTGNSTTPKRKDDPTCVDDPAWAEDCRQLAAQCATSEVMKMKCRKSCGCPVYVEDKIKDVKGEDKKESSASMAPAEAKKAAKAAADATKKLPDITNIKPVIAGETQIQRATKAAQTLKADEAKEKAATDERRAAVKKEEKATAKLDKAKIDKQANDLKNMEKEIAKQTEVKVVEPKEKGDVKKKATAKKATDEKTKTDAEADKATAKKEAEEAKKVAAKADQVEKEIKDTEAKAAKDEKVELKKESTEANDATKNDAQMRAEAESDLAESNAELQASDAEEAEGSGDDGDDELLEIGEDDSDIPPNEKEKQQWGEARKAAEALVTKVVKAGKENGAREARAAAQLKKDAKAVSKPK